jgi:hypothetical protein
VPKSGEFKNPPKELPADITKSFEEVGNQDIMESLIIKRKDCSEQKLVPKTDDDVVYQMTPGALPLRKFSKVKVPNNGKTKMVLAPFERNSTHRSLIQESIK